MPHALTRAVLGQRSRLLISDEKADEIKTAIHGSFGALSIEEKFNLILENFEELEAELLSGALSRSLFERGEWSSEIGELHTLNRRLVNLLATTRLYVDQVPHTLSTLFGEASEILVRFSELKSREYDAFLGYRAMEAMRNYMQHRSLPIHVIAHQISRREHGHTPMIEHLVVAQIEPREYREDGKFKARVLAELEALGQQVDLQPLARQYVACLARIHGELRAMLNQSVRLWDEVISSCRAEFQAFAGPDLTGLALVSLTGEQTYDVLVHITTGGIERRQSLERKNRNIEHYERALVASRPTA